MAPGAKFSTTTSARWTMVLSSSRPRSLLRLSVAKVLLLLSMAKGRAAPPTTLRLLRCSPPLASILMTRAPAMASMKVQ